MAAEDVAVGVVRAAMVCWLATNALSDNDTHKGLIFPKQSVHVLPTSAHCVGVWGV